MPHADQSCRREQGGRERQAGRGQLPPGSRGAPATVTWESPCPQARLQAITRPRPWRTLGPGSATCSQAAALRAQARAAGPRNPGEPWGPGFLHGSLWGPRAWPGMGWRGNGNRPLGDGAGTGQARASRVPPGSMHTGCTLRPPGSHARVRAFPSHHAGDTGVTQPADEEVGECTPLSHRPRGTRSGP